MKGIYFLCLSRLVVLIDAASRSIRWRTEPIYRALLRLGLRNESARIYVKMLVWFCEAVDFDQNSFEIAGLETIEDKTESFIPSKYRHLSA